MVCLEPWCTKDPRPCAKYFGLLDILLSVFGLVFLLCLPFLILKLDEEVAYIQASGKTDQTDSNVNNARNHTLNITDTYDVDCNEVANYIKSVLDSQLKNVTTLNYIVSVNKSMPVQVGNSKKIFCEIHVVANKPPFKELIIYKGKRYSVASLAASAISKYKNNEDPDEIIKRMTLVDPGTDEISVQYVYPGQLGNDPERRTCIEKNMANSKREDIQKHYDLVHNLLMASGIINVIAGVLVMTTEYKVSKPLLLFTLMVELCSTIPLVLTILFVGDPKLCLLQYGGISNEGQYSPKYLQTIITYTIVAYLAAYKGYCIWFLAMYTLYLGKLRETLRSASTVGLTRSEEQTQKEARKKTIQRLMGKDDDDNDGGMLSESPFSSEENVNVDKNVSNVDSAAVHEKSKIKSSKLAK